MKYGGEVKIEMMNYYSIEIRELLLLENPELSFASKYRYPALVRSGFNPEFLTYLSNEKSNEKTQFEVTYTHEIKIF